MVWINIPFRDLWNKNNVASWEHVQTDRPIVRMTASIRMFYLDSGRIRNLCKETGRERTCAQTWQPKASFISRASGYVSDLNGVG